jgi:hypothetical protein
MFIAATYKSGLLRINTVTYSQKKPCIHCHPPPLNDLPYGCHLSFSILQNYPPRHFTDTQSTKFANAYCANKIILTQQLNTTCDALLAFYYAQTGSNLTFNNDGATSNLAYSSFAHMANKRRAKLTGSLGGVCFSWDVDIGDANRPKNHTKTFFHHSSRPSGIYPSSLAF